MIKNQLTHNRPILFVGLYYHIRMMLVCFIQDWLNNWTLPRQQQLKPSLKNAILRTKARQVHWTLLAVLKKKFWRTYNATKFVIGKISCKRIKRPFNQSTIKRKTQKWMIRNIITSLKHKKPLKDKKTCREEAKEIFIFKEWNLESNIYIYSSKLIP